MFQRLEIHAESELGRPDRLDAFGSRSHWGRAALMCGLCLAIFDGAHFVHRATRSTNWYEIRALLASQGAGSLLRDHQHEGDRCSKAI